MAWPPLKKDLVPEILFFEIITENEKFVEYHLVYLSLRVLEYYIEHSIEHQPAKASREIEHALIRQYAIASESYAPKFVCP